MARDGANSSTRQSNGRFAFNGGVSLNQNYPRCNVGPCKGEYIHRVVAAAMLKRPLRPDEDVHHRDGDFTNFRHTNLLVLSKAEHGAVSNKQRWYLKQLYSREEAAYRAYFDVTGKTYEQYDEETSFNPQEFADGDNSDIIDAQGRAEDAF